MNRCRWTVGLTLAVICWPAATRAQGLETVSLTAGTEIQLVTTAPFSSKTSVKGDLVPLTVDEDVRVGERIIIPKGSAATGQIADARAKGALGMSGKLLIRPLYVRIGDDTVRLTGAINGKGSVTAGAVAGMVLLTPAFTGRSAAIPAGTRMTAIVERSILMPAH